MFVLSRHGDDKIDPLAGLETFSIKQRKLASGIGITKNETTGTQAHKSIFGESVISIEFYYELRSEHQVAQKYQCSEK